MGVFGFVAAGGGSIGVLLGGILTDVLSWHWILLVNLPIGILVYALSLRLLPAVEARVRSPLVPLGMLRLRNVATANVVGVLWAAAMFAWFFLSACTSSRYSATSRCRSASPFCRRGEQAIGARAAEVATQTERLKKRAR